MRRSRRGFGLLLLAAGFAGTLRHRVSRIGGFLTFRSDLHHGFAPAAGCGGFGVRRIRHGTGVTISVGKDFPLAGLQVLTYLDQQRADTLPSRTKTVC